MAVAYFRTSSADPGTTTEIAVLIAYLLGALAYTRSALAVGLAVVTTVLLVSKPGSTAPARSSATWNSKTPSNSSWWHSWSCRFFPIAISGPTVC